MVNETLVAFFVIYRVHNIPPPNGLNPINIPLRHNFQIIFNNIPIITPLPRIFEVCHVKIVSLLSLSILGLLGLSCI
jgi:hypothetical protein